MSLSTLTIQKDYHDGTELTEGQLDSIKTSIEAWAGQVASKAADKSGTETISGAWTFAVSSLKIAGAGAGTATLAYANSGSSRTLTFPADADDTVVTLTAAQTLTGKTLTAPNISAPVLSGAASGSLSGTYLRWITNHNWIHYLWYRKTISLRGK